MAVRIAVEQRRARLVRRHHLGAETRAVTAIEATRGVVALHSTDPASVFLSLAARVKPPANALPAIEHALYDERSLYRMLGMRRTMFVVPVEDAPIVQSACTDAIAVQERRKLVELLGTEVGRDPARWLADAEEATVTALTKRGEATGATLGGDVPALRQKIVLARGKPYEAEMNLTTRVLFLLSAEGRIVRGRPRGSWISSQYYWRVAEPMPAVPVAEARTELVRRWLRSYGPGTEADLKWWTGWTLGQVRQALAGLDTVAVDLDGVPGLVLADDLAPVRRPKPSAAFLPALDPTVMGWIGRAWFLGEHGPALFDRSGNAGPTIWWDGRIVGGWVQLKGGEVAFRLLEEVGRDAVKAIDTAAAELRTWLAGVRVTPRFRTPLERELGA